MKSSFISMLGVLLFGGNLWSAQWEIPAQGIQEVFIRAKAARVIVQKSPSSSIRVKVEGVKDSSWIQEVQNGVLKVVGPEAGISVEDTSVTLEIPAGIINCNLIFEDVRADLQSVSRVMINTLKGKVVARSTGDGVRIFMQKGEVQSYQHLGGLDIESFGGKISVTDGQSALKIRLFNGDLQVDKNIGTITLDSQSSSGKIVGQQGIVNLQWGKGSLVISEFSGRLAGTSNDGQIQLQIKPDTMIDLQANRGRISVNLPSDSGASLNVRSATGDVSVPGPLKAAREGRFRVARGKLTGALKGSITIRAEDASIGIR